MLNRLNAFVATVEDTLHRALSSRKFLAASAAFTAAIHAGKTPVAAAIAAAYLVVEGYVDSKRA